MSSIRSILEELVKDTQADYGYAKLVPEAVDQALKDISELIDGAKPETPIADSWRRGVEKSAFEDAIRVYQYKIKELLK